MSTTGEIYVIAFFKDGSIITGGDAIIKIWPNTGQYQEIISVTESGRYRGIAVAGNSEVFVTKVMCCPRSNPTICRLDLNKGTLNSFSGSNYLINPYGIAIRNQ